MPTPNFGSYAKIFYRPIDAAVRWCNLMANESMILEAYSRAPEKLPQLFPQWPCLHVNLEKIYDAIRNHELPYGYLGVTVLAGTPIDILQITIRHSDIRHWMSFHYPEQKPSFLFGPIHETHANLKIGAYISLQADRESLLIELKALQRLHQKILSDLETVGLEPKDLRSLAKSHRGLSGRSELTYQQIIGALLSLFLSRSPAGKPLSVFESQAAIVDAVTARHKDIPGLSKRTLDEKFAAANRSLKKTT